MDESMQSVKIYATIAAAAALLSPIAASAQSSLLNVSYDPTRELYQNYNKGFQAFWLKKTGKRIDVQQSHGGSGKQARAVLDGLSADVVTLGIATDIDELARAGLVNSAWRQQFPNHSVPYTSTIVFVVRKGNPKRIHDWPDLIRPGVDVVTPNPKTSSGGRWAFLAAYGWAQLKLGSKSAATDYIRKLYRNVPILDSGARGSTNTFVERGQGDVLLAWENEAFLITRDLGKGNFQIVDPSLSIRAEAPVAVVDRDVDQHHTREAATLYLSGLYSAQGQRIAAENFYRPVATRGIPHSELAIFPPIKQFTFEKVFGDWDANQKQFFDDGGLFDQVSTRQ